MNIGGEVEAEVGKESQKENDEEKGGRKVKMRDSY